MRILQLRLTNLNSLSGEWAIDFTHPDYQAGGLFAITGATGVGKTTVLDAICLALYGATPRLGRITKSFNEIMSRLTGECAAELTFETQSGRFRAHWSQRRSRKKADGELQEPRHEIVDDQTGRVIESSRTKTLAAVESLTGMDFDQFTRSMMLAQGAFAAFLQAPADERADLLEQITGTDIYSVISIEAHRRKVEERKKKEEIDRLLQGAINPEHDESTLTAEREATRLALAELDLALAQKNEAAAWLKNLGELEAARVLLLAREQKLASARDEFAPEIRRLESAAKARLGDGLHGQLKMIRTKRDQAAAELTNNRKSLPDLEKTMETARAKLKAGEEAALKAKKEDAESRPRLNEVRALDLKLRENDKRQLPLNERLKSIAAELAEAARGVFAVERHDFQSWSLRLNEINTELAAMRERFAAGQRQLAALLAGRDISAWRDDLLTLSRRGDLLAKLADELTRRDLRQKEVHELDQAQQKSSADLAAVANELKSAGEHLNVLEREAGHLEARWALQQRVRSLEAHRPHLTEGRPCPLCGALEHPYADPQNIPADEVTEAMVAKSKADIETDRKKINALTADESGLKQQLAGRKQAAEKLLIELTALGKNIDGHLAALNIGSTMETELPVVVEALAKQVRKELAAADQTVRDAEKIEKELTVLDKDLNGRAEVYQALERLLKAAAEVRADLEILREERSQLRRSRQELFGEQHPDDIEKSLQAAVKESEAALEKARLAAREAEAVWEKRRTIVAETGSSLKALELEINALAEKFQAEISGLGFADESAWLAAGLPEEVRAALEKRARNLAEEQAVLDAGLKDNAERLLAEKSRSLTVAALPEVESERSRLEAGRLSLLEKQGVVNQRLADYQKAVDLHRELLGRSEAQNNECRRWDRLHELIGSADGKKFRNFAQGLTFEMMVHMANKQLVRLSDRYLLTRDAEQPLELKVIDNYQAGEIRSTKNLSGGESFIVSLALALGLSQMASRKVRVDSLFLDEGFGSLDEDSLDIALETLAGLNEDGKLIGVISHVPTLINRITTQIKVRSQNGPHSRLSGPGVSGGGLI